MTIRFRHIFPKPAARRVWWLHPGSAAAAEGKEGFLVVFLSFLSFTLLSITFLFCSAIIGEQKEIPLYCISDYDVTSQSFQSMSDTDLLQIKSIAIETTFRNTFPFSQKKNTFLTLLLFTSQSFQLMWDGDLFQIKSIAIQTTQIFKFDSSVLSNLTVRLRFIFVAWKICQGPMFFSSLFNVHTFCI